MKRKIIILVSAFAAFVSCSKESVERDEKQVSFSTHSLSSRGTVIADEMGLVPDGFDAWTYEHTEEWNEADDAVILIDGGSGYVNVTSTDGQEWDYGTPQLWPEGKFVSSFAIAPHAVLGAVITPNPAAHEAPTIEYTVPAAAASQQDLLIATAMTDLTYSSYNGAIPEVFHHALSRIEIKARKGTEHLDEQDEVIVTGVKFHNIYGKGTAFMDTDPIEWTAKDTSLTDYTLSVTGGELTGDELSETDTDIVGSGFTMFLLPQDLTRALEEEKAAMTVEFTINGFEMKWSGVLPGTTLWEPAHPYRYTIVIDNDLVAILCAELEPPTDGGDWGTF